MEFNLSWNPIKPYFTEVIKHGPNGREVVGYTGREYTIMVTMGEILNFTANPLPYKDWDTAS